MMKTWAAIFVLGGCCLSQALAEENNKGEIPPETRQAIDEAMKKPAATKWRYEALAVAAKDWVAATPSAAYEWAMNSPKDNKFRHDLVIAVVNLWVRQDLTGMEDYLTHRPGLEGWGALAGSWADIDPAAAIAWAPKQPQDKWPTIFNAIAEVWARKDGPAASAWAAQLPFEQGRYTYFYAAAGWAWQDPPAAAAWAEKLPDCEERNNATAVVANVWGRKIPAAKDKIIEWVKQLPIPEAKKTEILKQFNKPADAK